MAERLENRLRELREAKGLTQAQLADLKPGQEVEVEVARATGETFTFTAKCRIDTANEMEYYRNGGILHYVLRKLAA